MPILEGVQQFFITFLNIDIFYGFPLVRRKTTKKNQISKKERHACTPSKKRSNKKKFKAHYSVK